MKTKITRSVMLALLWLALPVVTQAQFTFVTNGNNTITITGYTGSDRNVTIPSTTNGYPVTTVGNAAFWYKSTLTGIIIPNSVTSIGSSAFHGCSGLTDVTIPDSLASIGDLAFGNCSGLTNITVNAANPSYASAGGVLFNKALTLLIQFPGGLAGSYALPDSVIRVGDSAFGGCSGLTNVTIPKGLTSIGSRAFKYCSGLADVTISDSITNIGRYAFLYCMQLHQINFQGNAPSVDGMAGSEDSTVFYLGGGHRVLRAR